MHRLWRERVTVGVGLEGGDSSITWLMPLITSDKAKPGGGDKDLYFVRDKSLIRQADLVFGLIEDYDREHNRHSGLSAELGMAHAWGIPIILLNLLPEIHSFEFLEKLADSVFYDWEEAIRALHFVCAIT